jgi:general secretion pathway protein H
MRSLDPNRKQCGAARGTLASRESRVPDPGASGVTLMEMLVVIALASIVLAVVFPAVGSGLNTLALRSAGTRLAAAARYARDQAVYRQKTLQFSIDSGTGEVAVAALDGSGAQRYQFPDAVRVQAVLPAEDSQRSPVRRFYFYPDGAAPDFQIVLTNSRRQLTVIGDPLTGTTKVVEP